jgi:hypothetical protein
MGAMQLRSLISLQCADTREARCRVGGLGRVWRLTARVASDVLHNARDFGAGISGRFEVLAKDTDSLLVRPEPAELEALQQQHPDLGHGGACQSVAGARRPLMSEEDGTETSSSCCADAVSYVTQAQRCILLASRSRDLVLTRARSRDGIWRGNPWERLSP